MLTFKSRSDLNQLPASNPAYPLLEDLVTNLIDAYTYPGHPYIPSDYGYIVLIEEVDVDAVINLPEVQCNLLDVLWEGAAKRGDFYLAIYLWNDDAGMSFVIPDAPWVKGKLRELLDEMVEY
jgi:hypothetical protein